MELEALTSDVQSLGYVSGLVWTYLNESGAVTLSKLAKEIEAPRDLVMQGVGWLAREGKIKFEETPRARLISLS